MRIVLAVSFFMFSASAWASFGCGVKAMSVGQDLDWGQVTGIDANCAPDPMEDDTDVCYAKVKNAQVIVSYFHKRNTESTVHVVVYSGTYPNGADFDPVNHRSAYTTSVSVVGHTMDENRLLINCAGTNLDRN